MLLTPEMARLVSAAQGSTTDREVEAGESGEGSSRTLAKEAQTSRDGEGQSTVRPGEKEVFFFRKKL